MALSSSDRLQSGAKTATATVVEEREPGIRAGPTGPERRSGEARAACRGDPRRRRRALAERSVDGPACGPAREGRNELEERVLQGVSAAGQKERLGGAGVLARHYANRAEIEGGGELGCRGSGRMTPATINRKLARTDQVRGLKPAVYT
jgi:hypothetical protein